jgi:hypothetical protein
MKRIATPDLPRSDRARRGVLRRAAQRVDLEIQRRTNRHGRDEARRLAAQPSADRRLAAERGAPPATDPSAEFTGKIVLTGELAKARTGAVFISVGPAGQRIVYISYKVDLADPKAVPPLVVDMPDGSREIHFVLNSRTSMMGGEVQTGVELELKAKYSPTGFVDPTPGIVETAVPTVIGATDVVLTLHS